MIDNCNHQGGSEEITKRFSLSALRAAKRAMPGEYRLYTPAAAMTVSSEFAK